MIDEEETNPQLIYQPTNTAYDFHRDDSFVRILFGVVGCGKSVGGMEEIIYRAMQQEPDARGIRRTRWAVIRNTYPDLKSTTIATWLMWYPEATFGRIKWDSPIKHHLKFTLDADQTKVDCEVLFIAMDSPEDIRKLMSGEFTGIYLNELQFINYRIFEKATERVNRYPSKMYGVPITWTGVFADTNPPDNDHWIYKRIDTNTPANYKMFKYSSPLMIIEGDDPAGVRVEVSKDGTRYCNDPACDYRWVQQDPDYWLNLVSARTDAEIRVNLMGQYGYVQDGKPVHPTYNDLLHYSGRKIPYDPTLPLGLGWDFGLCYSDDTEVLTECGWKLFKDVNERIDKVATRNPQTGEMIYTAINFKTEFDYEGDLIAWENSSVNFCVTPDHRVPFTYRDSPTKVHFKAAKWLYDHHAGHHYVDLCSNWSPDFDDTNRYFGMDALTFCEFMGLYLSEGNTYKAGNSYRISICQNHQNPVMEKMLFNTGLPWLYQKDSAWRVTNRELGEYLKSFGCAADKFIPYAIRNMPSKFIRAFIYSYTMGDGHIRVRKNGSIEHTVFTISKTMADDLQELAQKAGWNSSLRKVKPQNSVIIENNKSRLITNNGGYSITFKKRAKRAELLAKSSRKVAYKGKIYCLNVPFHTLYVRRNGKPSWNGNTPACAIVQLTKRGQLLVLGELWSEDMGLRDFASNVVIPHLDQHFIGWRKNYVSRHDPAGSQRSQTEANTCQQVLDELQIKSLPAATSNDPTARKDGVDYFLGKMTDGMPSFLVSMDAPMIRKGFSGAYKYARMKVGGDERYHEVPLKNIYSHICEAIQYIAMFYAPVSKKPASTGKRPSFMLSGDFMSH